MTVRTVTEVEVYNYYSDENAEWLVAPCSLLSGVRLIPVWRCGISMLPYGCINMYSAGGTPTERTVHNS